MYWIVNVIIVLNSFGLYLATGMNWVKAAIVFFVINVLIYVVYTIVLTKSVYIIKSVVKQNPETTVDSKTILLHLCSFFGLTVAYAIVYTSEGYYLANNLGLKTYF